MGKTFRQSMAWLHAWSGLVVGWVLFVTMLFFSSLAFTVLENAMSLIFVHRVVIRRRHFLLSALLPYCYILFLGVGALIVTLVSSGLEAVRITNVTRKEAKGC